MKKLFTIMMAAAVAGTAMAATAPGMQKRRADVNASGKYGHWTGDVTPAAKAYTPTRAASTLNFTYAGDPYTALTANGVTGVTAGKDAVVMAFEIPAADVKRLVGTTVKSINVTTGTNGSQTNQKNPLTSVSVFISRDLSKNPAYSQDATLGNAAWAEYKVALTDSYTITEEDAKSDLYIGYRATVPLVAGYYIPVDGNPTAPNACLLGIVSGGVGQPKGFDALGDYWGALCLGITLEGENLPSDWAKIVDFQFPNYVKTGENLTYQLQVQNLGVNAITSFEVTTQVGNETPNVQTVTPQKTLTAPGTGVLSINNVPVTTDGLHTVKVSLTKVNGVAAENPSSIEVPISAYVTGYDRNLVVEDATGTWCGWCPGGIEMLEYIKEKYGERFFAIGVHSGDAMYCADYEDFLNYYITGFPTVLFNRVMQFTPTISKDQICAYADNVYSYFTSYPSYAKIGMDCKVSADEKTVSVDAAAEFAMDITVPHYMAFVVVDDDAGAFVQTNYFAKGQSGASVDMGVWNSKASKARWTYTDVARVLKGWPGIAGSIPASIQKGTEYKYSTELPIEAVAGTKGRIVGFVVNGESGEIMNAAQFSFNKVLAVDEINGDGADISIEAVKGAINVTGAKKVAVYTLDGRETGISNLPAGLYIVKADNVTRKVMVK